MNQIIVDESAKKQLLRADEPCEVVDSAGNKLGHFTPQFMGYECPYSAEELRQAELEEDGRPLEDILADLDGRK